MVRAASRVLWCGVAAGAAAVTAVGVIGALSAAPAQGEPGAAGEDSIVETFAYPNADQVLAEQHIRLISGDGHIVLADCATPPVGNIGVIKVRTDDPAVVYSTGAGRVCFQVTGSSGRLDLLVPGVFEIRGDGQVKGTGHTITATVTTEAGPQTSVTVNPYGSTTVGLGADATGEPTTLLQLRVTG